MSSLVVKWTDREIGGAQTPRRFLDFVIDGESLYEKLGDLISPLGWGNNDEERKAIDRFLRKSEPDLPNNRTSIYVCPECGDLGCGAISAVIEGDGDNIVWRDFGYENNYDEYVNLEDYRDVGPFTFNATEYSHLFSSALNTMDRESS